MANLGRQVPGDYSDRSVIENAASANFEQVTTKEDLSGLQLALLRKQYVYIQSD